MFQLQGILQLSRMQIVIRKSCSEDNLYPIIFISMIFLFSISKILFLSLSIKMYKELKLKKLLLRELLLIQEKDMELFSPIIIFMFLEEFLNQKMINSKYTA
jgi:hypothetical protein